MNFALIAFSRDGAELLKWLCAELSRQGDVCEGYIPDKYFDHDEDPVLIRPLCVSSTEWAKMEFSIADCLIFIGATGIAVRSVAPWLENKFTDPAVVVVDDTARFAISLLSGHAGRANMITQRVASILNAESVITTSSDVHGILALDEWAMELGLLVSDHDLAKKMASFVLNGGTLGFMEDPVCKGYCACKAKEKNIPLRPDGCEEDEANGLVLYVTPHRETDMEGEVLRLIPRCLAVGVGCKKGVQDCVITDMIKQLLEEENLDERAIFCFSSIDLKSHEPGIVAASDAFSVPYITYPSAFLDALPGHFSESEFVRKVTGTGNVCERAACAAASLKEKGLGARLLVRKYAENGVTLALAIPDYSGFATKNA